MFTRKIIAFANANDDGVLDIVPLNEVRRIRDTSLENEIIADDDSDINGTVSSNNEGAGMRTTFEIETDPVGYNSGRVYKIQAASAQDFRTIFDNLTNLSTAARDEAEAKSRFEKSQQQVGKFFNSKFLQRILVILIFGVRNN